MKVLVNGIGNIGTTLINLLVDFKEELAVDEIYACKRSWNSWSMAELNILEEKGVKLIKPDALKNQLKDISYVFEATDNGVGIENLELYRSFPHLKASAQGSEKNFGQSFMSGINESLIQGERFVHIVSCNTHGTASLLKCFTGDQLENLQKADMVVVRRSEDLGNHKRLVSGNVVARHLSQENGTHHAIDVVDMFKLSGIHCDLTSSDITTPSQLMHSVRFHIEFKEAPSKNPEELIEQAELIAKTQKFDSNVIFELGRRYGYQGRLFNHAIIVANDMLFDGKTLKGWAFVPQEGNTILSTIHAFMLQTNHSDTNKVMSRLQHKLIRKIF